jgi:hypothetical protein
MFIFCHQNAGHNHNIKISDKYVENLTEFRYLGRTVTYQICIGVKVQQTQFGDCLPPLRSESLIFPSSISEYTINICRTII